MVSSFRNGNSFSSLSSLPDGGITDLGGTDGRFPIDFPVSVNPKLSAIPSGIMYSFSTSLQKVNSASYLVEESG